jgi:hypothetical protein
VNRSQVMPGAERRAVLEIVRPSRRAEPDVVILQIPVRRAAWNRAAPPVAREHPVLLGERPAAPPGLEGVIQHRLEGLILARRPTPSALDAALHRGQHRAKQPRDVAGRRDEEPSTPLGSRGPRTRLETRGESRKRGRVELTRGDCVIDVIFEPPHGDAVGSRDPRCVPGERASERQQWRQGMGAGPRDPPRAPRIAERR